MDGRNRGSELGWDFLTRPAPLRVSRTTSDFTLCMYSILTFLSPSGIQFLGFIVIVQGIVWRSLLYMSCPPFAISLMYMEISSIMLSPETSPHLLHIRGMIQVVEIIIGLLREFDLLEQFLGRSSDLAG